MDLRTRSEFVGGPRGSGLPEADEHFLDEIFEGSVGEGGQIFGLFSRARFHI